MSNKLTPFLKWAGGKRQIVNVILDRINDFKQNTNEDFTFFEPFVGGGIVFLSLQHTNVVINDFNQELINVYNVVKNSPKNLLEKLSSMKKDYNGDSDYYYRLRELDRNPEIYSKMSNVDKAARTIFINKTCYNGLYRVNQKGQFNTPIGKYKDPMIFTEDNILAVSKYLNDNNVQILKGDYASALNRVKEGDIIYLDPPYHYEDEMGFTAYQKEKFSFADFERLKSISDDCLSKGAHVIISNNETTKVRKLFENDPCYVIYDLHKINTNRMINSKGKERKTGKELLILGYPAIFPSYSNLDNLMNYILSNNPFDELLSNDRINYSDKQNIAVSLKFLGIIDEKKLLTNYGRELIERPKDEAKRAIADKIIELPIFSNIYINYYNYKNNFYNEIKNQILLTKDGKLKNSALSNIKTIECWVTWCNNILGEKNENCSDN